MRRIGLPPIEKRLVSSHLVMCTPWWQAPFPAAHVAIPVSLCIDVSLVILVARQLTLL